MVLKNKVPFIQDELKITVDTKDLNAILTIPLRDGPHPAIVLLHGSDRSGKDDAYYVDHAKNLVESGFAVLRYDGPGWGGKSSEGSGFETLESRTEEAISIVKYLQSRPDIQSNAVGLWGISQGGWICQMAAAASDEVAFIIPVSGPGVTPAEQEAYRVEAESKADGFSTVEVEKAVLMRRLMVDIVLVEPVYQAVNQSGAQRIDNGPWIEVMEMIYDTNPVDPIIEFDKVIELLNGIKTEAWTKYLHLDEILPMFESLPPQAWEIVKGQMRAVLKVDPADFLSKVHCPVLAIFGDQDTSVPVEKSVTLYKQYLAEARNDSVTIKVFPSANHGIKIGDAFAPGYFETLNNWLSTLLFIP